MSIYKFIFNYLKQYSIPVFKSFFKAYKDTTAQGGKSNSSGGNAGKKQHPFDQFFSSMMSKTNLSAPPLDQGTAMQILNIQKNLQQVQPKFILQRYYTLFKKNDPQAGGTTYLQSKVFAAKQALMAKYQNATQIEHQFYKQVIQPQQKGEKKQSEQKTQEQKQNKK